MFVFLCSFRIWHKIITVGPNFIGSVVKPKTRLLLRPYWCDKRGPIVNVLEILLEVVSLSRQRKIQRRTEAESGDHRYLI